MVAANARTAISFALSPGQASDAKQGRLLLGGIGPLPAPLHLIMDRASEDNETRQLALDFGFIPVVPPQKQSPGTVAVRQGSLPQAQRSRTLVSTTQGLPPHLLPLRQTRRPLSWISQLRANRRSLAIVLTRP
jgi:hypothetical protein